MMQKITLRERLTRCYYSLKQRAYRCCSFERLVSHDCFQNASIAIVGNAGYLAEMKQGKQLDSYDLVLRMNNFKTSGYEATLGSRTDIFLTNFYPPHIDFANPDLQTVRYVVSSRPNSTKPISPDGHRLGNHVAYGMKQLSHNTVYAPAEDDFEKMSEQLGAYPTTGLVAIQLALDYLATRCQKIYITGFSFFSCQSHYFTNEKTTGIDHQVENEKKLLQAQLQDAKNITLDPIMAKHLNLDPLLGAKKQHDAA